MEDYELTILFKPEVEENVKTLEVALDKIGTLVEATGGKIEREHHEGVKRLAYDVKGYTHALYYWFELQCDKENAQKIAGRLNYEDDVLRYLIIPAIKKPVKE